MNIINKSISIDRVASSCATLVAEEIISKIMLHLKREGKTVATAESCTGGLVGKMLTDISGASAVYLGGIISYTNEAKINILGVSPETLAAHTEVSAETVAQMACNVREKFGADYGLATTGYAGPTGGTSENPVGTVYVAFASENICKTLRISFSPDMTRGEIREATAGILFALLEKNVL